MGERGEGFWDVDEMLYRVSFTPGGAPLVEVWGDSGWRTGGTFAGVTWNGERLSASEAAERFGTAAVAGAPLSPEGCSPTKGSASVMGQTQKPPQSSFNSAAQGETPPAGNPSRLDSSKIIPGPGWIPHETVDPEFDPGLPRPRDRYKELLDHEASSRKK